MKQIWTSETLSTALDIKAPQGISGQALQFNSKDLSEGDIFIALKGNTDGHAYVSDALSSGAGCAIVSQKIESVSQDKLIIVEDTYKALYALAEYKRKTSKAKFIGITGSVGKTSTKEIIFGIAKNFGKSFVSRANFNNHLGLPLNLASMPDDIEYGIFELGMNRAGELSELSKFLKPDIAVITNIAPVHLAHFNSMDDIAAAKAEIFEGVSDNGFAILNLDDKYCDYFIEKWGGVNYACFGKKDGAMSQLYKYEFDGRLAHIEFKLKDKSYSADTTLAGHHMARNLACGLLVSEVLGFNTQAVINAMKELKPVRGRGEQIELELSNHKCILIHDCYNAGPVSVTASLKHLANIKHENKIAILADMRDLGAREKEYHRDLAKYVLEAGISKLCTVGTLMRELHDELKGSLNLKHFNNSNELLQEIVSLIKSDSLILMKGSKSTGLLAVADYLIKQGGKI